MDRHPLKHIIEAALLTAGKPLNMQHLQQLLADDDDEQTPLAKEFVQAGLDALSQDLEDRGIELKLVASGYRLQVRQSLEPWIAKLFEERPPRYSRALLETLALIGYRQPITRAEIEDVRGVSVSSNIIRTLLEREWIKVVGHRDVPGRPSMYGTTKQFLDYFNLKSLGELPELGQLMDLEKATAEFDKASGDEAANDGEESEDGSDSEAQDAEAEGDAAETTEAETAGDSAVGEDEAETGEASAEIGEATTIEEQSSVQTDETGASIDGAAETEQTESGSTGATAEDESDVSAEASEEADPDADLGEHIEAEGPEDGESQEDIDADVESLIRMLDAEASADTEVEAFKANKPAAPAQAGQTRAESSNTQHEAASGESITPADLLRRHSTDFEH